MNQDASEDMLRTPRPLHKPQALTRAWAVASLLACASLSVKALTLGQFSVESGVLREGEWVVATVVVGAECTSVAGRVVDRGEGDLGLTFADRDCVLLAPDFLAKTTTFSYRPSKHPSGVELHAEKKPFVDVVAQALGFKKLRVVRKIRR